MDSKIIDEIAKDLSIKKYQVFNTLKLLQENNTICFIARYRKEKTGSLDEVKIKKIFDIYMYQTNLLKRKEEVIRLIDEKGLLKEEIRQNIMNCSKLIDIDDIYRPYQERKKTKATEAISLGLEGLAKIILSTSNKKSPIEIAKSYKANQKISDEEKLVGASYIISEYISLNSYYRKWIRNYMLNNGMISSKLKKDAFDSSKTYEMYYDYKEKIKNLKPHRILAINRGEKEKVLQVSITADKDKILEFLESKVIKNQNLLIKNFIKDAILDSYKRLIYPSIVREIRNILTKNGEECAISNFSLNISKLLMTPPISNAVVLGFDPAFRTGCKLAVLDKLGNVLKIDKIYPHEPVNDYENSKKKVLELIDEYKIDIIAIGNGTASRESEMFIASFIKEASYPCKYIIVSEAGASIYSASNIAIEEFPNLDVCERSAISIGRRIQDPLSELVKIDPKGIGVGLYQHDVPKKQLDESLRFSIEKIVNSIGVNINTASSSILSYVSGLTKKSIKEIIERRNKEKFKSRMEIKNIEGLQGKIYEQAIGFLRITDGINPLDKTNIHPESYEKTYKLLEIINANTSEIGKESIIKKLDGVDITKLKKVLEIDEYTLLDIIKSLKNPMFDPRNDIEKPILKDNILEINDLRVGMKLQGVVRNVVDFGVFVDIGLHNDGLVHISQISKDYIKHPSDVLNVGDIIDVYVKEIFKEKEKVSLSLFK